MITDRDTALLGEIKSHIDGICKSRADMLDAHLVLVKVVADAIECGAIPPMPIEFCDKMKFANASEAMRDHVLGLIRSFVEFTTGENPEKKEVAK